MSNILNMKEVNTINNILNDYLSNAGFKLTAELGTDFGYYYAQSKITYALALPYNEMDCFREFCYNLNPNVTANTFIISLFHEIFHNETIDDLDDDTYNYCIERKIEIASNLQHTDDRNEMQKLYNEYFALPVEIIATMGALDYIESHLNEVKALWEAIVPHINAFYIDNKVEIDNN